jgi:endoglucanase
VIRYGRDHWDAARIESEMKQAAEWARRRGVPLVCNEFGVFREYSDPQDRAAWLHDVRAAFERNGIGWAMWDYSGSFGVVTKKDGKAVADEGVLRALGLKRSVRAFVPRRLGLPRGRSSGTFLLRRV